MPFKTYRREEIPKDKYEEKILKSANARREIARDNNGKIVIVGDSNNLMLSGNYFKGRLQIDSKQKYVYYLLDISNPENQRLFLSYDNLESIFIEKSKEDK